MKKRQTIFIVLIMMIFSTTMQAQTQKVPADYVHVPGPILFDKQSFNLSWSSHPQPNFYKQEYIVKGDNPDQFKMMVLTDVLTGGSNLKDVVSAKISELKRMKETNPLVNYEVISNPKTGEYMIDFLLSANGADGVMNTVERNVYRYRSFTDKSGKASVQLFGVSVRSYGKDITRFLTALKASRKDLVNKVSQFNLPEVKI
ncbi:MAG: hypothetical protein ABIN94_01525 [Ferruginibacter sp.]